MSLDESDGFFPRHLSGPLESGPSNAHDKLRDVLARGVRQHDA
jgi:hypothetical protein